MSMAENRWLLKFALTTLSHESLPNAHLAPETAPSEEGRISLRSLMTRAGVVTAAGIGEPSCQVCRRSPVDGLDRPNEDFVIKQITPRPAELHGRFPPLNELVGCADGKPHFARKAGWRRFRSDGKHLGKAAHRLFRTARRLLVTAHNGDGQEPWLFGDCSRVRAAARQAATPADTMAGSIPATAIQINMQRHRIIRG